MADRTDGEGRTFELPELTDDEAAVFADELLYALAGAGDAELELADGIIVLSVTRAGDDRVSLSARVVPPAGSEEPGSPTGPLDVELGTLAVAEVREHVVEFHRSVA